MHVTVHVTVTVRSCPQLDKISFLALSVDSALGIIEIAYQIDYTTYDKAIVEGYVAFRGTSYKKHIFFSHFIQQISEAYMRH